MRALPLALLLALSLTVRLGFASQDVPPRTFDARDLFFLQAATDPQINPDGTHIVYVRRSGDVMVDQMRPTLWLIDTRTGEETPLATQNGSYGQPRWSPDGRRIAYISKPENGPSQLFVRWLASGESVRVTGLPDAPDSVAWSPDGRQIAYTMFVPDEGLKLGSLPEKPEGARWAAPLEIHGAVTYRIDGEGYLKPGFSHIFVVSANGGAPRQLSFGALNDRGPLSWTPDGRTIVFSSNRSPNWEREALNTEIHALDVASGRINVLTHRDGPDDEPTVSPDGKLIAYTGFDDRQLGYQNSVLYVMNRDGSGRRALTEALDRSVSSPRWAADSRSIFVAVDDRSTRRVVRVTLDGSLTNAAEGLAGAALDRPYLGGTFSVARNGAIAIPIGTSDRPPDVAMAHKGKTTVLTRLNEGLLGHKTLGVVRRVPVKSADQRLIDAWLTLPPTYQEGQRVPLVRRLDRHPPHGAQRLVAEKSLVQLSEHRRLARVGHGNVWGSV